MFCDLSEYSKSDGKYCMLNSLTLKWTLCAHPGTCSVQNRTNG